MRVPVPCLAAVFVAILASAQMGAQSATLTVRVYNSAGVGAADLATAHQTAEAILGDTGLDIAVRHCGRQGSPDGAVDLCETALAPSEVVVRLIDSPASAAAPHADAYGVAYVEHATDRGWLATVFADRIHAAARRGGVEAGTLIGRVMAHEVGHLVLGSRYHGTAGLMRAEWPDSLLSRADDEWRFSTREAAAFRQIRSLIQ